MIVKTKTNIPPSISQYFDSALLSHPITIGDNLSNLHKIFVEIQQLAIRYMKYPERWKEWKKVEKKFMVLYGRTKKKEEDAKTKTRNKTQEPFYFIRLPDRSLASLWSRLRRRMLYSATKYRRDNEI